MYCPSCGTKNPDGARFCSNCAHPLAAVPAPIPEALPAPAPATAREAPPAPAVSAASPPTSTGPRPNPFKGAPAEWYDKAIDWLGKASREKTGLAALGVAFLVCMMLGRLLWTPLSLPPRFVNGLVSTVGLSSCSSHPVGSIAQDACSAGVALITVAGPVVVMAIMFVFRIPIVKGLRWVMRKMPPEAGFLAGPVVATLLFTMGWAGVHHTTAHWSGILRHDLFPSLVGVLTYVTVRYGPAVHRGLKLFFAGRDKLSFKVRMGLTIVIPLVISVLITRQPRVSSPAFKEQVIVLLAIGIAFLLLSPRTGDLAAGLRKRILGEDTEGSR